MAEQAQILRTNNEARCRALEALGPPGTSLENAFDALRIIVLLEHLVSHWDLTDEVNLDFEGRRSGMLEAIEQNYAQMKEAAEAARRQQVLTGDGGPPRGPRIVRAPRQ